MPKFTVGQKAEATVNDSMMGNDYSVGDQFDVYAVDNDGTVKITFPSGENLWVDENHFKAASQLAVGDTLIATEDRGSIKVGDRVVVIQLDPADDRQDIRVSYPYQGRQVTTWESSKRFKLATPQDDKQRVQDWIANNYADASPGSMAEMTLINLMRDVFGVTMEIQPARYPQR